MLIKTSQDINNLIENGKRMGEVLERLEGMCKPGVSAWEIDQAAEKMILEAGGRPAFKGYRTHVADRPFPATICASFNAEVVHGIPRKNAILKEGDIFSIDIGMVWPFVKNKEKATAGAGPRLGAVGVRNKTRGVFTDTAVTVAVGAIPDKTRKLLDVTRESMERGIAAALPGNSIADIGKAVESYVRSQGKYGIVRDLVGHGVGHEVHEEPFIPNYYDKSLESIKLRPGMVIAIEPMIALGDWRVETMDDGWTIKMSDNSLSAHFEHTVIITEDGNIVATRRPSER